MNADPRAALQRLVAALERHLEAVAARRDDSDAVFQAAWKQLVEAFEAYDDALYDAFGVDTPFLVYDEDDEEGIFDFDDEDDEDESDDEDPDAEVF
ncbi:MAG: DNA primase [Bifidobacteriaceae bacterium]|jgi:thioesterase domain-containing protein|nr:DNA primase [Bifidobacteriaceae bacterium]